MQFHVDNSPGQLSREFLCGSVRWVTWIDIREVHEQLPGRRSITCVTSESRQLQRIRAFLRPKARVHLEMYTHEIQCFTCPASIEHSTQQWLSQPLG